MDELWEDIRQEGLSPVCRALLWSAPGFCQQISRSRFSGCCLSVSHCKLLLLFFLLLFYFLQDFANAVRRLIWRFECWRVGNVYFLFFCVYPVFLEVAIARAEEERQMSLVGDSSGDSSLDRFSWSFDSLRRWERRLRIQHREYKAVS